MSISDFFNPSTPIGALIIGVISGLLSGGIIGFFTGRATTINKLTTKGDNSNIINNSSLGEK